MTKIRQQYSFHIDALMSIILASVIAFTADLSPSQLLGFDRLALPEGYDEVEKDFHHWCNLQLIEALRRCGVSLTPHEMVSAEQLVRRYPGATPALISDLLQILAEAAFLETQGKG